MADQVFNVNCGFFDAVNNDRTYSADDMNRPYKRIISNGVFATPQGEASTDLQVVSAGDMEISVNAGAGIFGDKWFESLTVTSITVPDNTNILPRIDSVIVQIDKRASGRVGSIVYRTGSPASTPLEPEINQTENVVEYRVANVYVEPSATSISNADITDLRGSSSCPWVTSLIYQVDTSTLFDQWQYAYAEYYNNATEQYNEYVTEQQQAWEDFLETLTSELTVATNVITFTSTYTTSGATSTIPINIASYNKSTDLLMVYINGLFAHPSMYTIDNGGTSIELASTLYSGQKVSFVVLHSIVSANIQSAVSMIQSLDAKIDNFMQDSGWVNFTLSSPALAFDSNNVPGFRKVGNRVYLRGAVKNLSTIGSTICSLPVDCWPEQDHYFTCAAMSGASVQATTTIRVSTDGDVEVYASTGALSSSYMIPLSTCFSV